MSSLIPLASSPEEERKAFSDVTTLYTDLDGTLLAPGGKLLTDSKGSPSARVCEAEAALRRAGVQIVVITGRSRIQCNEFIRLLDAEAIVGEMGCTKQERGTSNLDITYDTGEFEWDREKYETPWYAIKASGAVEALFERYKGRLEYNVPRCLNRDVTHAMRGYIDPDEAAAFLKSQGYNLVFVDNGMIFTPTDTKLVDCPEIRGYHLMPEGASKAKAVRDDMAQRGLSASDCVSVGDGYEDIAMGECTGSFVMMRNGLRHKRNEVYVESLENERKFVTSEICCDGWVELANAILRAKGLPEV